MKNYDYLYWWEEYFTISRRFNNWKNEDRFELVSKESGRSIATGDSYPELNEKALILLDKIFEENVLSSK